MSAIEGGPGGGAQGKIGPTVVLFRTDTATEALVQDWVSEPYTTPVEVDILRAIATIIGDNPSAGTTIVDWQYSTNGPGGTWLSLLANDAARMNIASGQKVSTVTGTPTVLTAPAGTSFRAKLTQVVGSGGGAALALRLRG